MMYSQPSFSTIDLSYETTDTIEEFTVELQVQWWEALEELLLMLVVKTLTK
jgi:hypothetical protein